MSKQSPELYQVVVNDELQYSIWRVGRAVPAGWRAVAEPQDKESCLAHIEDVWTDMRPLSVREALA